MDNRVYAVECRGYDQAREGVRALFDLMGGMGQFVTPGDRIVLKPNLLMGKTPEKAVTTHPAVVGAVGHIAHEAGAELTIADSPGTSVEYRAGALDWVYRKCGMDAAAEEASAALNQDTGYEPVSFPEGHLIKRFQVIAPILEADGVFNLCKLKTHTLTGITGAVKNNFGVIPGLNKQGHHVKLQEASRFSHMLLDLSALVAPRVSVMDAVVGMEGNGPNAGEPRRVGLLLAARNPLALDVVASAIIGLDRQDNPLLQAAEQRNLRPNRLEQIELVGAKMDEIHVADYALPKTASPAALLRSRWLRPVMPLVKRAMTVSPRVIEEECVACGACRDACPVVTSHPPSWGTVLYGRTVQRRRTQGRTDRPVDAITIPEGGPAHIDDGLCIRCYCCHEMCPHNAIELRRSLLYRLIGP